MYCMWCMYACLHACTFSMCTTLKTDNMFPCTSKHDISYTLTCLIHRDVYPTWHQAVQTVSRQLATAHRLQYHSTWHVWWWGSSTCISQHFYWDIPKPITLERFPAYKLSSLHNCTGLLKNWIPLKSGGWWSFSTLTSPFWGTHHIFQQTQISYCWLYLTFYLHYSLWFPLKSH